LKNWLIATYTVNPLKVSVLENTPHEQFLKAAEVALRQRSSHHGMVRLVYAGTIKESKGIGDIIRAMPFVISQCSRVFLRIIGDGPALLRMRRMVRALNLENKVEFLPMLSMPSLAKALAECDIGIESCLPNQLTHQTMPGKVFEYMALGLPVISSARRPVVRMLREVGCGQIYYSRSPREISQAIINMVTNNIDRREMGLRGRKAVLERYNWRSTLETLKKGLGLAEGME